MSKRFTDTNKYKKPFIRGLQGAYKLFWDYLYHECDHAGIWIVDFEVAQLYVGKDMPINKPDALKYFNTDEIRIVEFDKGARWFLPSFIDFQYGELNENNRAHNSVICLLKKHNLLKYLSPLEAPTEGAKDKDKEKDMVKEKDKDMDKEENSPEIFEFNTEVEELYNSVLPFFEERFQPKTKTQVKNWKTTIDKLLRIDRHNKDDILNVIQWARSDSFWSSNFLSLTKLRELDKSGVKYFDKFQVRISTKCNGNKYKSTDY